MFAGAQHTFEEAVARLKSGEPLGLTLDVRAEINTKSKHSTVDCVNVVGILKGSDPDLSREYIVYTAHLDHEGIGRPVDGDDIYNGALDNASGVAALLETARAFASLETPPRRSVVFLALTAEEKGLLGADYFANRPTVPLEGIVANVNIDGVGVFYPAKDIVAYGAEHSSLGELARQAAEELEFVISPDPFPEETFFIRSDQYPFIKQGIPALFFFPGLQSADPEINGAEFLQKWMTTIYHSPKDDMSQDFDFEEGARVTRLNFLVGYLAAQNRQRPTWNTGDFFGEKFGRSLERR
jgi:Zn-dependent M28 family amino/carboxypeptidase